VGETLVAATWAIRFWREPETGLLEASLDCDKERAGCALFAPVLKVLLFPGLRRLL